VSPHRARGQPPRFGRPCARGIRREPPHPERPKRRNFTAEYKLRIVREADDALASGGEDSVGALLRREGLYSSYLTTWRRERDEGELAGLTPKQCGRKPQKNPLAEENARLQRENERLQHELYKANTIIDVQKKLAALLGETLPMPTAEDFARTAEQFQARRRR
jgi:transposase